MGMKMMKTGLYSFITAQTAYFAQPILNSIGWATQAIWEARKNTACVTEYNTFRNGVVPK